MSIMMEEPDMRLCVIRAGQSCGDGDTHLNWIVSSILLADMGRYRQFIELVDDEGELVVVTRRRLSSDWREVLCLFGKAFNLHHVAFRAAGSDEPYEVVDVRIWEPARRKGRRLLENMLSIVASERDLQRWRLRDR